MESPLRSPTPKNSRYYDSAPCSMRLRNYLRSDTSGLISPGSKPNMPGYAQPTIAYTQHLSPTVLNKLTDDSIFSGADQKSQRVTFRAGASKRSKSHRNVALYGTIDESVNCSRDKDKGIRRNTVSGFSGSERGKEPLFVQLFNFNKDEPNDSINISYGDNITSFKRIGNHNNMPIKDGFSTIRSTTYRSPRPKNKVELIQFDRDINTIIQETDNLIEKMGVDDSVTLFSKEQLLAVVNGKQYVEANEWIKLVEYHYKLLEKYDEKIKLDHELIHNILELNNTISRENKEVTKNFKILMEENEILKSHLNKMELENTCTLNVNNNDLNMNLAGKDINSLDIEICSLGEDFADFHLPIDGEVLLKETRIEGRYHLKSSNELSQLLPTHLANLKDGNDWDLFSVCNMKSSDSMIYNPNSEDLNKPRTMSATNKNKKVDDVYNEIYQSEKSTALGIQTSSY